MKINFMRLLIFLPAFLFMAARIYIASVYVYEDVRKSERFFNVWSHYFSLIIDWMLWLWKRIYEFWKKNVELILSSSLPCMLPHSPFMLLLLLEIFEKSNFFSSLKHEINFVRKFISKYRLDWKQILLHLRKYIN